MNPPLYKQLNIFLRAYSNNRVNPDRPQWFDYEKVFVNLLETTKNDPRVKLNVVFEGDWDNYFVKKYLDIYKFNVIYINTKNGNVNSIEDAPWSRSVAETSRVIKECNLPSNELIYILEDDYLHRPGWVDVAFDFFNNFNRPNDYICLYDNPDKYLCRDKNASDHWGMYKDLTGEIELGSFCHWKTSPNCGMSMIMPAPLFIRDYEFWGVGMSDCDIGHKVVAKHQTKIWIPLPSISTHCIHPWVAPYVDWNGVLEYTTKGKIV